MSIKEDLVAQAQAKNIALTGNETIPQLKALLGVESTPAATPAKGRNSANEAASFEETKDDMRTKLAAQPTVKIFVPLDIGEKPGTQLPVNINGLRLNVPKGVYVEVPQTVADIVVESLESYSKASEALRSPNDPNRPLRLDLADEATKNALNA